MSLEENVMAQMKDAMRSKDEAKLRSLRAIKAEIIKAKTEPGAANVLSDATELQLLQKLVKQRKESLEIFEKQERSDLAKKEKEEIDIIEKFLPAQLTESELRESVQQVIHETGATSPADMGRVMGVATKQLAGKADGKSISAMVKQLLSR